MAKRMRMQSARPWAKRQRLGQEPFDPERDLSPWDLCAEPLHLSELTSHKKPPAILICRVSTRKQKREGKLDHAISKALRDLAAAEFTVVRVVAGVESSHIDDDRPLLRKAFRLARKYDAVVVAPERDRLIRPRCYDGTIATEEPTDEEYRRLREMAGWVCYVTILDPAKRGRGSQTTRGMKATERKIGRPKGAVKKAPGYKKRFREERIDSVRKLRDDGRSFREIQKVTGVDKTTAGRWIREPR